MSEKTDFATMAEEKRPSMAAEVLRFLMESTKWWLLPIVLLLLLFGALAVFATTGAAPLIYTLF
jgi:hypothetical protein